LLSHPTFLLLLRFFSFLRSQSQSKAKQAKSSNMARAEKAQEPENEEGVSRRKVAAKKKAEAAQEFVNTHEVELRNGSANFRRQNSIKNQKEAPKAQS